MPASCRRAQIRKATSQAYGFACHRRCLRRATGSSLRRPAFAMCVFKLCSFRATPSNSSRMSVSVRPLQGAMVSVRPLQAGHALSQKKTMPQAHIAAECCLHLQAKASGSGRGCYMVTPKVPLASTQKSVSHQMRTCHWHRPERMVGPRNTCYASQLHNNLFSSEANGSRCRVVLETPNMSLASTQK